MEYLFIDYENVALESLPGLKQDQTVYLFLGPNQKKVWKGLLKAVHSLGSQAHLVDMEGEGKNALDFHIAFYLGKISSQEPDATFLILSGDTGFDPLITHMKGLKVACARIPSLPRPEPSPSAMECIRFLMDKEPVKRPKGISALQADIKNHTRKTDAEVQSIIQEMIEGKRIALVDGKVSYLKPG